MQKPAERGDPGLRSPSGPAGRSGRTATSFPTASVRLPLIDPDRPQRVIAWRQARSITQQQFLQDVRALAGRLPHASYALNICTDRYWFMVGFAAVCVRGQTNLLAPTQSIGALAEVARAYPGSYVLGDGEPPALPEEWIRVGDDAGVDPVEALRAGDAPEQAVPLLGADHVAAIVFTSGSTGLPQPHPKSWRNLVMTARLAAQRFLGADASGTDANIHLVSTVPSQHMYGLETTVMLVLAGGCSMHVGRALFPADLRDALLDVPAPRVLITTPIHLRACRATLPALPPLRLVISATAVLDRALALEIEAATGAPVHEIYGCTEAGSMASRRTVESTAWEFYPGMRLRRQDGRHIVLGDHLDHPVAIPDVLEDLGQGRFRLCGRSADLLKLGGKRSSVGELTVRLLRIPGVEDAVVFVPEPLPGREARPAALVVAPNLSVREIVAALEQMIDPVFVPRPLLRLPSLPRNAVGKLPQAVLMAALERAGG